MDTATKTFLNPSIVAIEHAGDKYMLCLEFKDKKSCIMEASSISGNICINNRTLVGFDSPETFETYYDCNVQRVEISRVCEAIFLDIYVQID